ncbi:MAG: TIGR00341 family protein [Bacteroidales bacterium]|nr:TIGR00341 family protein [Bacteroidales bacterium]
MNKLKERIADIVNVSNYIDIENASDSIKKNIEFRGPNFWVLTFAIIIASVGLNVNSIPVIIGAMLISPLMGPIIGLGLGLGTNDTTLLKHSLSNLGIMVLISIAASSLYFLLSPLEMENPTELLARTNPTIYDVMIALFGGFAGIFEISRKDKGTVFSGVAIATALMPPLCTIGYGIAILNVQYIFGALYLFFINSVFIALATFIVVKYFKFPKVKLEDLKKQRKLTRNVSIFTLILIIPSIWSAIVVINENSFNQNAKRFIADNKAIGSSYIYDYDISHDQGKGTITISLGGEPLSPSEKALLIRSAEGYGISANQIVINDHSITRENLSEKELMKSIFERNDEEIKRREELLDKMDKELKTYQSKELPSTQIAKELLSQYPDLISFSIARGDSVNPSDMKKSENIFVLVKWKKPVDHETVKRLQNWLSVRLDFPNIKVIQEQ